jgi:hypothetical protein
VRRARGTGISLVLALVLASVATPAAPSTAGAAGTTPVATPELGRLFMTPAERSTLDARRGSGDSAIPAAPVTAADAPPARVVLNGVLTRSRGPDVVWINGTATGRSGASPRVQSGATPRVTVGEGSVHATLKPGQVWTPGTGQVKECLGCQAAAPPTAGPADARTEPADPAPGVPPEAPAADNAAGTREQQAPADGQP